MASPYRTASHQARTVVTRRVGTWQAVTALAPLALAAAACATTQAANDPSAVPPARAPLTAPGDANNATAAVDAGPPLPKLGQPCADEQPSTCIGERTAAACIDHVWTQMKCRGPSGCRFSGPEDAQCDQSIATESETCLLPDDVTCSPEKDRMLRCLGHAWRSAQSCGGELGCTQTTKSVKCDNSIATLGDACLEEDDYACTFDKKHALRCGGGRFAIVSGCAGPKGCSIDRPPEGAKVSCDDSVTPIGGPCEKDSHYACSLDSKTIVVCRSGVFVVDERCKGKQLCGVRAGNAGCY